MYVVKIYNDEEETTIHGFWHKLSSGKIVQSINAIDSFSFCITPSNIGFNKLEEYKTLVSVYNADKNRYEFYGRVLYTSSEMNDTGFLCKNVVCESYLSYLCDSLQYYVEEQDWTVRELFEKLIGHHNVMIEERKRFVVGEVDVAAPNDTITCEIPLGSTWEAIQKLLIDVLGGEIRFRVTGNGLVIDYLAQIGETKTQEIALSKNMKTITQEKDPTQYITKLIPYGAKLSESGEERLRLDDMFISDPTDIAKRGIRVGYVIFDDVTDKKELEERGKAWYRENTKMRIKYSITALDLSLINLLYEDFELYNYYPIKNSLLGINDTARVIKRNIDICDNLKSSFEIGDNFKSYSEMYMQKVKDVYDALNAKVNGSDLSKVATSGNYTDLFGVPKIPTNMSDLNNDSGYMKEDDVKKIVDSYLNSGGDGGDDGGNQGGNSGGSGNDSSYTQGLEYDGSIITGLGTDINFSGDIVLGDTNENGDIISGIGDGAFQQSDITTLQTGANTQTIGNYACEGCNSLTEAQLAVSSSLIIGDSAFENCENLSSVTVNAGLQNIGANAFANCGMLTEITFIGSIADWENIPKGTDWDLGLGGGQYTIHCQDGDIVVN